MKRRLKTKEEKMETKDLILWIENLVTVVGEAYETKDYDWAYLEEIKKRLAQLDKINEPPDDINVPF